MVSSYLNNTIDFSDWKLEIDIEFVSTVNPNTAEVLALGNMRDILPLIEVNSDAVSGLHDVIVHRTVEGVTPNDFKEISVLASSVNDLRGRASVEVG